MSSCFALVCISSLSKKATSSFGSVGMAVRDDEVEGVVVSVTMVVAAC